jgi:hypothetical protein
VTSWNGTGPDTDLTVPSGGTRGRTFVRAVSFMDGSTPRTSRMNIVDSDLGFLGFNGSESYGVSYKARGCGASTPAICNVLDVFGTQTGSTLHDNYIGTYTWGAKDMQFDHNKYTHNKYYGLVAIQDPRGLIGSCLVGALVACRLDRRAGSVIMAGCPGRGRRLMRS